MCCSHLLLQILTLSWQTQCDVLIWLCSHTLSIITFTYRAKRPCFCICQKKLALKACLVICHECGDMLDLTVSSERTSLPFPARRVCTHTHSHLADEREWKGRVSGRSGQTSKIDVRTHSVVFGKKFPVGQIQERSRWRRVGRGWSGFCLDIF